MSIETCCILVGGQGTRLRSLFPETPKPLVPVGDQCFLELLLESLSHYGLKRVILLSGYKAELFEKFRQQSQKRWNFELLCSTEETPLGSGGALKHAEKLIPARGKFLLVNGDTFFDGDLTDFLKSVRGEYSIGVSFKPDASRFGLVNIRPDSIVESFEEKKPGTSGQVYAGIAVLDGNILGQIPQGVSSLENDTFPKLIGLLSAHSIQGNFYDIGLPESYEEFLKYLKGKTHA